MTNFNERMNTLLYKDLSHFILERVMVVVCDRWVGDGDRLLYWPQVLLLIIAAFNSRVAQPWVAEGPKPSVCKLILTPLAPCLQLTQAVCALVISLFNVHLLPLFFRLFSQVHLLIDVSVESQYITLFFFVWNVNNFVQDSNFGHRFHFLSDV